MKYTWITVLIFLRYKNYLTKKNDIFKILRKKVTKIGNNLENSGRPGKLNIID